MNSSLDLKTALLISLVACCISLFFSLFIFPSISVPLNARIDPDRIGQLATNISEGKGFVYNDGPLFFPAFDRGPVYPYVVAALFWISGGKSFAAVQIFQSIFHAATCLVVFVLATRVFDRRVGMVSQIVCAVHPMLVWYTSRVWVETFHTLALTLAVLALVIWVERMTIVRSLGAGLALGVAVLTKSVLLLFPVVVCAYILLKRRSSSASAIGILLATTILVLSPWTLRNYNLSGAFVPVHTSLGLNMIQGDAIGGHWRFPSSSTAELWKIGKHLTDSLVITPANSAIEPVGDGELIGASISSNFSHPLFLARRVLINGLTFWYLGESELKSMFILSLQLPLVLLIVWVTFTRWKANPMTHLPVLIVWYYCLVHALIVGWARYSVPIIPICVALAVYGYEELRKRHSRGRVPSAHDREG